MVIIRHFLAGLERERERGMEGEGVNNSYQSGRWMMGEGDDLGRNLNVEWEWFGLFAYLTSSSPVNTA